MWLIYLPHFSMCHILGLIQLGVNVMKSSWVCGGTNEDCRASAASPPPPWVRHMMNAASWVCFFLLRRSLWGLIFDEFVPGVPSFACTCSFTSRLPYAMSFPPPLFPAMYLFGELFFQISAIRRSLSRQCSSLFEGIFWFKRFIRLARMPFEFRSLKATH